jgi:integral membrane protein (TIGR00529 family)
MREVNAINKLIFSLKTLFSHKITIGLIPAIYGLMPVPGGALFSAPLVDKEGIKLHLKKNQRNFINVWFRHIWFPIYPISSAMILICSKDFTGLDYDIGLYKLIIANIPSFILFIIIGGIFLRIFTAKTKEENEILKKNYTGLKYLLIPTAPIILYIVVYVLNIYYPFVNVQQIQKSIFIFGLFLSFIFLFIFTKIHYKNYLKILKKSFSFNIAFTIFGIMIFREMFEITQINKILADMIQTLPFPPLLIIILIPLLLGLITGYNLGAIALSYVVIEPLFYSTNINIIGLTSIIFISSFVGYLISPIHLCNVVSSDHFKTDTTRMYKMYIPSVLIILIIQTCFVNYIYGV